jgi:hypothetical protein
LLIADLISRFSVGSLSGDSTQSKDLLRRLKSFVEGIRGSSREEFFPAAESGNYDTTLRATLLNIKDGIESLIGFIEGEEAQEVVADQLSKTVVVGKRAIEELYQALSSCLTDSEFFGKYTAIGHYYLRIPDRRHVAFLENTVHGSLLISICESPIVASLLGLRKREDRLLGVSSALANSQQNFITSVCRPSQGDLTVFLEDSDKKPTGLWRYASQKHILEPWLNLHGNQFIICYFCYFFFFAFQIVLF